MRAFGTFALRDGVVFALTVALVAVDAAQPASGAPSFVLGLGTGASIAISSFLLHEWGHWLGAVLSGGRVSRPRDWRTPFLFHFDTARSTRGQFLWMSFGGYLASVVALGVIIGWADSSRTSGWSALALAGLGVLVTLALELPTTVRVARGAPLPTGGVYDV